MSTTKPYLSRADTVFSHHGFKGPDPFAPRRRPGASFINAVLATALFRCWHLLLFFAGWASLITVLNDHGHKLFIQPTLLTVIGTVLGFVISYRTTSSFERYNEGRRLWSQIILASRAFARSVWFHVQDQKPTDRITEDEQKARTMIEKKTVINLIEAFAVAIKHYLRGEDGIYYQDLYHLVKFLPAYAMPAGIPSQQDLVNGGVEEEKLNASDFAAIAGLTADTRPQYYRRTYSASAPHLPPPIASGPRSPRRTNFLEPLSIPSRRPVTSIHTAQTPHSGQDMRSDDVYLLPAHMPPKYHLFDLFPFSLLVKFLTKRGKEVKGKKAARLRAKMRDQTISHNIPLEISLYLASYISSLQTRGGADVATLNQLFLSLNQLVDGLTGLERILTTPIPFSYSIHLWLVTVIYCLALPFQIWQPLKWLTIPSTVIASFMFFGFLVAGEEIENPFGYDKNDLNLDHFTHNIIRNELKAITSTPTPDVTRWAFSPENDLLFSDTGNDGDRIPPERWVDKGYREMQSTLSML